MQFIFLLLLFWVFFLLPTVLALMIEWLFLEDVGLPIRSICVLIVCYGV